MRVAGLAAALLFALSPAIGLAQRAPDKASPTNEPSAGEAAASQVPLEEIRRFVAVYNAVRAAYVEPVDDKQLMQSAVRGLLLDLDPHSTYFDKEDAEAFDEQASGAYEGIGVDLLQQPDNTLLVVSPIDDTPAAKAGIKAGDLVRGAAKVLGGGGGGKPDFAQGGGVDASKIDEALEALKHEAQKA